MSEGDVDISPDLLFPVPTVLSPRLQWLAKHRVFTHKARPCACCEPWSAWFGQSDPLLFIEENGEEETGFGLSETDAIAVLATRMGLRLWNEEGGA